MTKRLRQNSFSSGKKSLPPILQISCIREAGLIAWNNLVSYVWVLISLGFLTFPIIRNKEWIWNFSQPTTKFTLRGIEGEFKISQKSGKKFNKKEEMRIFHGSKILWPLSQCFFFLNGPPLGDSRPNHPLPGIKTDEKLICYRTRDSYSRLK